MITSQENHRKLIYKVMDILSIDFLQTFGDLFIVQIEVNFAYDIFYVSLRANNNESELRPI